MTDVMKNDRDSYKWFIDLSFYYIKIIKQNNKT